MVIALVRATYADEMTLQKFLTEVFGPGKAVVIVSFSSLCFRARNARTNVKGCSGNAADTNAQYRDN
jgi:hypothetical protein